MPEMSTLTMNGTTYEVVDKNHRNDKNNPHGITLEQIGASPANTRVVEDMINTESVTFTIIGDPTLSGSSSRQIAEIIVSDQGGGIHYLSLAFDAQTGAPRSTLLKVAGNDTNTIASALYQTSGNETKYSIHYKSSKLYSFGQVIIPRFGNTSVKADGIALTEGESLGVSTSNVYELHNLVRPNGGWLTVAEDSNGSELDNVRQQGGWRLTSGLFICDMDVTHLYHFNGLVDGHHFCCMQIGCSYGSSPTFVIRWNWYGTWSAWRKI